MPKKVLKSNESGVFLQKDGANTPLVFLGCMEVGDISQPYRSLTPVRCQTEDGKGWEVVAELEAPPGNPTTSLTTLLRPQRSLIEQIRDCPANLFFLQYFCGPRNIVTSYTRGEVLHLARPTTRTFSGLGTQEDQVVSKVAIEVEGEELLDVNEMVFGQIFTSNDYAFNDIWVNSEGRCNSDCNTASAPGAAQYAVSDGSGGVKAKVYKSIDKGETWAALAADPGAIAKNLMGIARIVTGVNTYRLVIPYEGEAAAQGVVYLSDDDGATYTTVNVGGAAAGHGIIKATAFFMPKGTFGFIATRVGYIYKTIDNGATWTAVESGVIHAGDWSCIHFCDENYGIAGGAADVIAVTSDGGETWTAATATGAGAVITCCQRIDKYRMWVGTSNGRIYYSNDGGTTWTRRTGWVGDGVGAVRDLVFINEMIGYMARNTAGPAGYILKTIDGGENWKPMNYVTNLGVNRLGVVSEDFVMVAGEPTVAPDGLLLKGVAAYTP